MLIFSDKTPPDPTRKLAGGLSAWSSTWNPEKNPIVEILREVSRYMSVEAYLALSNYAGELSPYS